MVEIQQKRWSTKWATKTSGKVEGACFESEQQCRSSQILICFSLSDLRYSIIPVSKKRMRQLGLEVSNSSQEQTAMYAVFLILPAFTSFQTSESDAASMLHSVIYIYISISIIFFFFFPGSLTGAPFDSCQLRSLHSCLGRRKVSQKRMHQDQVAGTIRIKSSSRHFWPLEWLTDIQHRNVVILGDKVKTPWCM